ncbi:MAG: hypothetical protein H7268_10975 [Sandarakinorhabdus sp.]|nr:hypothetical protein [Sandarakinorhabdus sp.]
MALSPPGAPIVIAHCGASADRPEHRLAGYALPIDEGGGFIEPDLVSNKDHQLVARHEAAPTGLREYRFAR